MIARLIAWGRRRQRAAAILARIHDVAATGLVIR